MVMMVKVGKGGLAGELMQVKVGFEVDTGKYPLDGELG